MKKFILLVSSLLSVVVFSQNDAVTKVGHSEIVEVESATAATLTSRANAFLKSKKIDAKMAGIITTGIGSLTVTYPSVKKGMTESGYVKFNLKLMIKDGKYKIDLSDFKHEGIKGQSSGGPIDLAKAACGDAQITNLAWSKIKEQTQTLLKSFIEELKNNMDNPAKSTPVKEDF